MNIKGKEREMEYDLAFKGQRRRSGAVSGDFCWFQRVAVQWTNTHVKKTKYHI